MSAFGFPGMSLSSLGNGVLSLYRSISTEPVACDRPVIDAEAQEEFRLLLINLGWGSGSGAHEFSREEMSDSEPSQSGSDSTG